MPLKQILSMRLGVFDESFTFAQQGIKGKSKISQNCLRQLLLSAEVIRNAVPKKDKKDGRENLKTEKVFNMTM